MIDSDEEFQESFKKFMKSKGVDVETRKYYLCEDLGCNNCILKDVRRDLDFCTFHPFEEIKRREKEIRMLKQQISIMQTWKISQDINNKVKDFCKTLRTNSNDVFSCRGIDCNDCLFNDMDNFSEWVRQAKTRGEKG